MNVSDGALSNSETELKERLQAGRITWTWPLIVVFARLILAAFVGASVAGLYALRSSPTPWQAAAPWWVVYGTLIDVGCLVLLAWLTRREGIRLFDLIGFERQRLGRDLLLGLGFIVLFFVLFMVGGMVFGPLIYGATPAPLAMSPLPLWGTLYSALAWPLIWAVAEEMTYLGYALPRLTVLSKHKWLAVLIVALGWAVQHSALPILPSWQWVVYRFASSLPMAIGLPIVYLRTRRLLPFIIAHWAMDLASIVTLVVLPLAAP